jgi:hypothetical protein
MTARSLVPTLAKENNTAPLTKLMESTAEIVFDLGTVTSQFPIA